MKQQRLFPLLIAVISCSMATADDYDDAVEAGAVLVKTGRPLEAINAMRPYYASDQWAICFWLGSAHLLNGDLELARAYLDEALQTRSDIVDIWIQRSIVEQETGRPEVAIELLRIAASLDADESLVHLNLGYALEQSGRINDAMDAYRSYLSLASNDPDWASRSSEVMARLLELANERAVSN